MEEETVITWNIHTDNPAARNDDGLEPLLRGLRQAAWHARRRDMATDLLTFFIFLRHRSLRASGKKLM